MEQTCLFCDGPKPDDRAFCTRYHRALAVERAHELEKARGQWGIALARAILKHAQRDAVLDLADSPLLGTG